MRTKYRYMLMAFGLSLFVCFGQMGIALGQNAYMDGLKTSYEIAVENMDYESQRDILKDMARSYYEAGIYEKAFSSHLLYSDAKDSAFNHIKAMEVGKLEAKFEKDLVLDEEEFQESQAAKKIEAEIKRRDNLQQFGILIFLIALVVGVFMSGKFRLHVRLAEGLIFLTFLMIFEFSLVLLDPFTESLAGGSPVMKLGINALFAGIIFPLHQFFESTLKKRIVSK
ncbi:MAG: hypothetical protein JKX73_10675 [Flavobacteriales bacterium]|nr:hypothetical protein [Flavobacteriales bacterium]